MPPLPTGTVTFLFTDIEGSTARWDHHPDAMRAALERHDALLRAAIAAHAGHVFKTVGDAFCAAFPTAPDALAAAVAAQRAVAAEDWTRFGDVFEPLAVRMGLHTGQAAERDGDYFGPPVNRAARIEAAGHGGQILASAATRTLVDAAGLPDGVRWRDRGEHRLKDLRHTEHLVQLVVDGLPDVAKDLRTAGKLGTRDRIVVVDPNAPAGEDDEAPAATVVVRTVDETLDALEAVVRGDDKTVVLTAEQVAAAARHKPSDWRQYRLGRIAEWSQPRYRLDGRFVGLTLLVDLGEQSAGGRWQAQAERYDDLGALLAAIDDPAVVVLGPPGGGKSTLLRRLELDAAIAALQGSSARAGRDAGRAGPTAAAAGVDGTAGGDVVAEGDVVAGDDEGPGRITFFVQLNQYAPPRPGDPLPAPGEWLAERWAARFGHLAPLDELLAAGRVVLLLDALNEMPAPSEADMRAAVRLWKDWLLRLRTDHPGNRVVFSCRALDYSQPLSTPDLRVPQLRVEPLADGQVRHFLQLYSPARWREVWAHLDGTPQLEVLRSPYFLALLVEQVEATGALPEGRAALFTGFVRQALRREVERGSPLFEPGELLAERDVRRIAKGHWSDAYDLPDRGRLLPKLAHLAHALQSARDDGGGSQVRVDYDDALDLLDDPEDEAIVAAGEALSVLDEDEAAGELMYVHQLVQEYFAAWQLARSPDPALVRRTWRAEAIAPSLAAVVASLDPADELPPLPTTGWEETTLLAAAMADDAEAFVRGIQDANLALAGRAAALPEVRRRLSDGLLDALRAALVERSRDEAADARDRIDCGLAAGDLDDPRYARRDGPCGAHLWPPFVALPAGTYPIGHDEPFADVDEDDDVTTRAHVPRHDVAVAAVSIARFPVTNAEWACFMAAGGYDDERWWDTDDARRWRRGELANEGAKDNSRYWRRRFLENPALFRQMEDEGRFQTAATLDRWRTWLTLDDDAFEAVLRDQWAPERATEPAHWRDARYNRLAQPVVGVSWYEARAYGSWLSAASGRAVRLPSEAEWEAAARGASGRTYPWGDDTRLGRANTRELRLRRPSPVGAFPAGDAPDGLADMAGNVWEWTISVWGDDDDSPSFVYPYDLADGREAVDAVSGCQRVLRGGSWGGAIDDARAAFRDHFPPTYRGGTVGFRLATTPTAAP